MRAEPTANPTLAPLPGGWLIVACLWFGAGLNYLDRIVLTTMHDSIIEAVPMSEKQFGLLTSIFLFVYGAFSPFAGYVADRFNRARVITASVFLWSAVTWLTSQATTYEALLLTRALMGISEACYIPAALALIADYHPGSTRSLATGLCLSGVAIGSSFGGFGGQLAEQYDWTVPFKLFGVIGIVFSLVLLVVLRNPPKSSLPSRASESSQTVGIGEGFNHLFSNSRYLLLVACFGLMGFAGWALNGWMPVHLKEQFNLSQGAAGKMATGYLHIAGFVGSVGGGFLSDRWNRVNPSGRFMMPVVGLCIAACGILLAGTGMLQIVAISGLIMYGVTRHFADVNMMPILCSVADARYRATGYGIMNFVSCLVGGIGNYAGGALRDANVNVSVIFVAAAGGLLLGATLFWLIKQLSMGSADASTGH